MLIGYVPEYAVGMYNCMSVMQVQSFLLLFGFNDEMKMYY